MNNNFNRPNFNNNFHNNRNNNNNPMQNNPNFLNNNFRLPNNNMNPRMNLPNIPNLPPNLPPNQMIGYLNYMKMMMMNNPNNPFNTNISNTNPNFLINPNQTNQTHTDSNSLNFNTKIQEILSSLINKNKPENTTNLENLSPKSNEVTKTNFEKDYSLEEENLKHLWSGFITRNKNNRVGVDAYQLRNDCSELLSTEYNLNVSHRTQFDEIFKKPIIGIIAFCPQNETQCEPFDEHLNYFNEKQRAGVVNFKNSTMYIIPPCDISRKFYQNPQKHLLGIFVNSNAEPKVIVGN